MSLRDGRSSTAQLPVHGRFVRMASYARGPAVCFMRCSTGSTRYQRQSKTRTAQAAGVVRSDVDVEGKVIFIIDL